MTAQITRPAKMFLKMLAPELLRQPSFSVNPAKRHKDIQVKFPATGIYPSPARQFLSIRREGTGQACFCFQPFLVCRKKSCFGNQLFARYQVMALIK